MTVHWDAVPEKHACEFATADAQRNKPYGMQSILQSLLLRLSKDKGLHNLQLGLST
jgi:hypothetical protein